MTKRQRETLKKQVIAAKAFRATFGRGFPLGESYVGSLRGELSAFIREMEEELRNAKAEAHNE